MSDIKSSKKSQKSNLEYLEITFTILKFKTNK